MNKFGFLVSGVIALLMILATPTIASSTVVTKTGLNFAQVQSQLGGMTCGGSTCNSSSSIQSAYASGGNVSYQNGAPNRCGKFVGDFDRNCVLRSIAVVMGGQTTHPDQIVTDVSVVLGFDPKSLTFTTTTTTTVTTKK